MRAKVIVSQHGSRHSYAIPRMLEQAGILESLYTDSTVYSPLGRVAAFLGIASQGRVQRLLKRVPYGIPKGKVHSSDAVFWFEKVRAFARPTNKEHYEYTHWCEILSQKMIRWGLGDANTLYNMYCENLIFASHAKSKGLRVVTDVYVNPQTKRIMTQEYERFPEWAKDHHSRGAIDAIADVHIEEMLRLSDLLLCPSQWVIDGLSDFRCFDSSKAVLLPYGCSINYSGQRNSPIAGRVLFAGRNAIRKGLPYLGQAAIQLRTKGRDYDFRIAGIEDERIQQQPLCQELNFIGKLTIDQMKSEFLTADVFVLPTLSEGFAGVCIEAMAAGVPVITTRCAGTTIRSGVDGVIVEERAVAPLADAIDECIQDRAFRDNLAEGALASSGFFSEDKWAGRLVKALGELE